MMGHRRVEREKNTGTEATGTTRKGMIPSLQVLRAFAFLGVFTSHCHLSSLGSWGASVFFVLSGFLMVYSYYDRSISLDWRSVSAFTLRKTSKLYLLHVLTMVADLLISVIFSAKAILPTIKANATGILLNLFLVQSCFPSGTYYFSMNAVAWFLSDCAFLYAVFPFLLRGIKRLTRRRQTLICMAVIYLIQLAVGYGSQFVNVSQSVSNNFVKWVTYICPLYRMGDFLEGGMLAFLFRQPRKQGSRRRGKIAPWLAAPVELCAVILLIVTLKIRSKEINILDWPWFKSSCLYLPSSLLLVWVFASNRGVITRALSGKLLLYIGNLSAYTYLIHQVVIHYIQYLDAKCFHLELSNWALAGIALIVSIALAKLYTTSRSDLLARVYEDVG